MKQSFIALFLSLALVQPSFASNCVFGADTWELKRKISLESDDAIAGEQVLYKTDELSLSNPDRLKGLSDVEQDLILYSLNQYYVGGASDLESFSDMDGYLIYFAHAKNNKDYVLVASYPGDNEYGHVFEVETKNGQLVKFLSIVASVNDGEINDCKVAQ